MDEKLQMLLLLLSYSTGEGSFPDVQPDSSQMLIEDFFSIKCNGNKLTGSFSPITSPSSPLDGSIAPSQWMLMRNTKGESPSPCGKTWGRIGGSSCFVSLAMPSDGGVYWCESSEGVSSDTVNITISKFVILQSPVHPVVEGETVTLRCRESSAGSKESLSLFKNDKYIRTDQEGQFEIRNVSKSDEGMYHCTTKGRKASLSSWLSVKSQVKPPLSTPPPTNPSVLPPSLFRLLLQLVVVCPFLISTILMGMICRRSLKDAGRERSKVMDQCQPPVEGDPEEACRVTTDYF